MPVRYRLAGSGDPLVLVYGLSGSWRWWTPVVDLLGRQHRLHLVELPRIRTGEHASWLGRWLDAAGLDRVDLLGHSLGGLLAAELVAERPERVRRLVLAAPAGVPCGRGVLGRTLPLVESLYGVRRHLPTIVADAVRTGPVGLANGVFYVWDRDLRAELASVQTPTLLVWGEHDRLVPTRVSTEWLRLLPHARLVHLPGGHVPMWEAPREFAACVLGFLAEELGDDLSNKRRSRVMNGMRRARSDDQAAAG